jgi:hypothetical protein
MEYMVGRAACQAAAPPREPCFHHVIWNDKVHNDVHVTPVIRQPSPQEPRLVDRPWKAIEEDPALGIPLFQPRSHHLNNDLVWNELTPVHIPANLLAKRSTVPQMMAEDIAR